MHVVAAADKFKGSATAAAVCSAIGHACWELGVDCTEVPVADGGEGTLDALGGANRSTLVTGPLGDPVTAEWRFHRGVAIIEMAKASGLSLVGGADNNDAVAASTTGVGELIDTALDLGAQKIIVCLGGSATTDGGLGAVRAIHSPARLRGVDFLVACDVDTLFTNAAKIFGAQKGAAPNQIKFLTGRLERLQQMYQQQFGVDVGAIEGSGAAGGLAGGLCALGARLVPGFELAVPSSSQVKAFLMIRVLPAKLLAVFAILPNQRTYKLPQFVVILILRLTVLYCDKPTPSVWSLTTVQKFQ